LGRVDEGPKRWGIFSFFLFNIYSAPLFYDHNFLIVVIDATVRADQAAEWRGNGS
jgi:hypothetical protein